MAESKRMEDTDSPLKGPTLSTSTSSFEALDPHDPNLSKLATETFQKTADYIHGELTLTQDHYSLLEQMNKVTVSKYSEMSHITTNLNKSVNEHSVMYAETIVPAIREIDIIEENIVRLEQAAYKLDNYTKILLRKFKSLKHLDFNLIP